MAFHREESGRPKIIVVMPVYNAAKTLKITYDDIPHHAIDQIILVDGGSTDKTLEVARELHPTDFVHTRNFGYPYKSCFPSPKINSSRCFMKLVTHSRAVGKLLLPTRSWSRPHLATHKSLLLPAMNSLQMRMLANK